MLPSYGLVIGNFIFNFKYQKLYRYINQGLSWDFETAGANSECMGKTFQAATTNT